MIFILKLLSKEFLCLKISSLIGWTIVLIDQIQDLDAFRKTLQILCIDSFQKTRWFLSCFITSYSGALHEIVEYGFLFFLHTLISNQGIQGVSKKCTQKYFHSTAKPINIFKYFKHDYVAETCKFYPQ